jgi:uncharacterized membrane protein YidH (DUF202 family)
MHKEFKGNHAFTNMDLSELLGLLIIQLSTLLIISIGALFLTRIWPFRKDRLFGTLFSFILCITVLYILVFLLRFPTSDINLVQRTGMLIPLSIFLFEAFVPFTGSLFAIHTIRPKFRKVWIYLLLILIGIYIVIMAIYPPIYNEEAEEWVLVGVTAYYLYVLVAMMFVPVGLFLFNLTKSKEGTDRRISGFLFASFLMYAILGQLCDPLGLFPPIGPRRVLIALSLLLLYIGFMTPSWASKILKI